MKKRSALCGARRGLAMAMVLACLATAGAMMATWSKQRVAQRQLFRRQANETQARWLVDAALRRGAARYRAEDDYSGETWLAEVSGQTTASVHLELERSNDGVARLTAHARWPDDSQQGVSQRQTITIENSSTE